MVNTLKKIRWEIAQSSELKWWQNYLKNKTKPEYLHWKLRYWESLLQKIESEFWLKDTDKIWDAGCGPAGIFMALSKHQIIASDPLCFEYEKYIAQFSMSDYPNTTFIKTTLEDASFIEQFNVVFCMNVINHVKDISLCLNNLVASIVKNGYLIISVDAHNFDTLKQLFKYLPGDILHPQQYSLLDYQAMLVQKKCIIERCILLKKQKIFNYYVIVARVC